MSVLKEILNGPGKSDLIFGLFDNKVLTFNFANDQQTAGPKSSRLRMTTKLMINITALEMEDGSGHKWNFIGINYRTKEVVTGFYDHNTKKGVFNIKKKFQITG